MKNYKKCKIEGCENNDYKHYAKGYCGKHYCQLKRNGKVLEQTRYDKNKIIDCEDYYEICLYNIKQEEVGKTKIDKEDLEKVKGYKWCINSAGYARARINKKIIYLHHLILGYPPVEFEIDHKFGDKLDNRKSELRFATHQQNCVNRKSKGYSWDKSRNKWQAQININKKHISLGYFINEQDAAKVAQKAQQKYYGEFAYKKNFKEKNN